MRDTDLGCEKREVGVMAMKGLLWKEWMQNRWYFLLAFTALGMQFSWGALKYGVNQQGNIAAAWAIGVKQILSAGSSAMETTAMVVAVLLAALMLAGERGNGLQTLLQPLLGMWYISSLYGWDISFFIRRILVGRLADREVGA